MYAILKKHFGLLVVWGVIFAILSGATSLLFPMQYSADSQVLIISRDRSGVDPYTQAKSAERVGEDMTEVLKTTDFYGKVMNSGLPFDSNVWKSLSERDLRKKWQQDVKPTVVYGTSFLRIQTFSSTPDEAKNFNNAIAQTLTSHGNDYIGGDVLLKQVDDPLVSRFPTRPNLIINSLAGFIIGVLLAFLWMIKYRRHSILSRD